MSSENLLFLALGVGGAYLLFKRSSDVAQAADASGTDATTKLPDNAGGAAPNADNARQVQQQGNVGILPRDSNGDVLTMTSRPVYGRGYGNDTDWLRYAPILVSKYQPLDDDKFNSAADNNGGMVIGSGYR